MKNPYPLKAKEDLLVATESLKDHLSTCQEKLVMFEKHYTLYFKNSIFENYNPDIIIDDDDDIINHYFIINELKNSFLIDIKAITLIN